VFPEGVPADVRVVTVEGALQAPDEPINAVSVVAHRCESVDLRGLV
jgi:hypothetical protein